MQHSKDEEGQEPPSPPFPTLMLQCGNVFRIRYCLNNRLLHGNVIPMGIPWETSHGMGQHTFV